MIHPDFLAGLVFWHDSNALTILDLFAADDAEGACILSRTLDVPCLVFRLFNDFLSLFLYHFGLGISAAFPRSDLFHHGNLLPSLLPLSLLIYNTGVSCQAYCRTGMNNSFEFTSILGQKFLYFDCHSGLDLACPVLDAGESSISELDSRWSLSR